ncbi:hypothetical protein Sango_0395800 [Sesamum angolense]|uniref:Mitochondrial inner membrane protease subunit 1 n=1 Tax=Sesamum angolense TaxID=2727404 RepID=A0AAE1XB08_9LAMI|nr:hypothetical protein Sango_0395800 [Sesamum angolense]
MARWGVSTSVLGVTSGACVLSNLGIGAYGRAEVTDSDRLDTILKTIFVGRLTFLHRNKGEEMAPTIGTHGGTLLVRKIPDANPMRVYVGDVVVLKDPINSDKYLVRRLAAVEGYEMASTDENDEPFCP